MRTFILDYYRKHRFELQGSLTEHYLEGHFIWNEVVKDNIKQIDEFIDKEDENWYLDSDGYRLDEIELFRKSPWTIIIDDAELKVVNRFMDYGTGEARFALQPWFRIGDQMNKNNQD